MQILADESVDFGIIRNLRQKDFTIISISENYSGISDIEVLKLSNEMDVLLITEDKDFGELTYRLKLKHKGILLIRLSDIPRSERIVLAAEIIQNHFQEMKTNFSVLNSRGLKIKKMK